MLLAVLTFMVFDVTAETRLPAGTILAPSHLEGPTEEQNALLGRQLTRTVFAGRAISIGDTKEADLVRRNNIVRMIARKGSLSIETKGRALDAGAMGSEILLMNLESRRTVVGRVIGPNMVEVDL